MVSAVILIPIAVAAFLFWHEWRQRKLPWPTAARERDSANTGLRSGDSERSGTSNDGTAPPASPAEGV